MSDELDRFKTDISLPEYAASHGYELDRKSSWRGTAVMRNGPDKIAITRNAEGRYLYYSFRDDADCGSIIDWLKKREGLTLGGIRKELRQWLAAPPPLRRFEPLVEATKNHIDVEAALAKMRIADRHPYLENERGIPPAVLACDRFAGRIHIDARSNAVFAHYDRNSLSGFELRNTNFKGFSSGGSKSLWLSNERPDDTKLVLCESSIDALSYAVAFPCSTARYASIGGSPSPAQRQLLRAAIEAMPVGAEIVAAMDSDPGGDTFARLVRQDFMRTGRADLRFRVHQPSGAKDWNDLLLKRVAGKKVAAIGGPSLA